MISYVFLLDFVHFTHCAAAQFFSVIILWIRKKGKSEEILSSTIEIHSFSPKPLTPKNNEKNQPLTPKPNQKQKLHKFQFTLERFYFLHDF